VSATIGNAFRVLARKGKADEETETDESKTAAPAA
jgi:hypothetical protein